MGPPQPRAGTLAEGRGGGRGGTWRGRGPRGRRHGWRMASLLSTLPLPPPPVTAPPRPVTHTRGCPSSTRPPGDAFAWRPASSRLRRASRPRAPWAPLFARASLVRAACASCPSRGFGPAAPLRARGPGLSLPRALPSPFFARPLSRYSPPPTGARAQSVSCRESAPQGLLRSHPHL